MSDPELTGDTAADAAAMTRTISESVKGLDPERADLLGILARSRHFIRYTTRDLTDDQARQRTTASELTLGGLIKHVTLVERNWADFIVNGAGGPGDAPKSFDEMGPEDFQRYADMFRLLPGETLKSALDDYAEVAAATDDLIRTLPDLNVDHALPAAPWFPPGERWTARKALLHMISETSQHSGHADIIRESLDGAKTMG